MSNSGFTKVSNAAGQMSDLAVSDLKVNQLSVNDIATQGIGPLTLNSVQGYLPVDATMAAGPYTLLNAPGLGAASAANTANALVLPANAVLHSAALQADGLATTSTLEVGYLNGADVIGAPVLNAVTNVTAATGAYRLGVFPDTGISDIGVVGPTGYVNVTLGAADANSGNLCASVHYLLA